MKKIKIGKNMKEVRIMRGLTQENLGEKVHLSTNYIGLIERNVDTPIVVQLSRQKSKLFIMN